MKLLISLLTLLLTQSIYAQVGINNDDPDPSAMLDITSENKGLLAPRMTTAQRNAILNPAEGLLVFDTDLGVFYFYDSGWKAMESAETRTNFKRVKSVTDLSEELTAGGGTEYLLDTDFLYEINGTVTFDFPINLNGAYIEGIDSSEDILVNNSASALFTGASAGSLRNLTLSGNGRELFNLTGSSTDLLIINNTVLAGASKVGSLSGLGTVFLSVTQYVSNSDGWTINNINNFFVSNIFWTASNTGTFTELTGSFNNLQMNGGRVVADASEIGIDVSGNPTIVNDATLAELSFVGAGTFVDDYTVGTYAGFNFTTDWNVNCSGIPTETDVQATANFYSTTAITTGFTQSIGNSTAVEVQGNGTFANTELFRFRAEGGNNRLVYEGERSRNFLVNGSLSVRVTGAAGDFYAFLIAKNGVVVDDSDSLVQIESDSQIQSVSINTVVTLETGDYVEVFVQRLTGNGNDTLVVFSENLTAN